MVSDGDLWKSYLASRPWALGIVVPEDAPLDEGRTLKWESSSNLTVVFTLPMINRTDATIYAIASVMTSSSVVLQAAAGIEAGSDYWCSYAMYVRSVYNEDREYVPVLLGSPPCFSPGDVSVISIYSNFSGSSPVWFVRITNLSSGEEVRVPLLMDGSSSFMKGDHEVFALESYTKNEQAFRNMENLVLHDVYIDGERVIGNWYVSDGLLFMKELLFEVGAGEPVPSFLYIDASEASGVVWGYSSEYWEASTDSFFFLLLIMLVLVIMLIILVVLKIR